jgi:hypothetical protein
MSTSWVRLRSTKCAAVEGWDACEIKKKQRDSENTPCSLNCEKTQSYKNGVLRFPG